MERESVHFHFVYYNVIYRSKSKESFPVFDIQNKNVREFPFVHTRKSYIANYLIFIHSE